MKCSHNLGVFIYDLKFYKYVVTEKNACMIHSAIQIIKVIDK